jgi:hypothetical protein
VLDRTIVVQAVRVSGMMLAWVEVWVDGVDGARRLVLGDGATGRLVVRLWALARLFRVVPSRVMRTWTRFRAVVVAS